MPRKVCYVKLPYSGPNCEPFGEKLKRHVEKTYSLVNLRVFFTAPLDLSKNIKFKDKIVEVEKQSYITSKVTNAPKITLRKIERILSYRIRERQRPKKDKKDNYISAV